MTDKALVPIKQNQEISMGSHFGYSSPYNISLVASWRSGTLKSCRMEKDHGG